MTRLRTALIPSLILIASAASLSAQDELYLEITQPGLRRVAVAAAPAVPMHVGATR